MSNQQITFQNKVGVKPKTVRINQVWDDDMNEIKSVVNENDSRALYQGPNVLAESSSIQVAPGFALSINDGLLTGIIIGDQLLQLDGNIKIIPSGVTPVVGQVLGYINADGTIGPVSGGGEDGNDTPITRGDAIEDIEPTALEVPSPVSGDTASVFLTNGKLEKWLFTTLWSKAYVLDRLENSLRVIDLGVINGIDISVSGNAEAAVVSAFNALPAAQRDTNSSERIIIKADFQPALGGGD